MSAKTWSRPLVNIGAAGNLLQHLAVVCNRRGAHIRAADVDPNGVLTHALRSISNHRYSKVANVAQAILPRPIVVGAQPAVVRDPRRYLAGRLW